MYRLSFLNHYNSEASWCFTHARLLPDVELLVHIYTATLALQYPLVTSLILTLPACVAGFSPLRGAFLTAICSQTQHEISFPSWPYSTSDHLFFCQLFDTVNNYPHVWLFQRFGLPLFTQDHENYDVRPWATKQRDNQFVKFLPSTFKL